MLPFISLPKPPGVLRVLRRVLQYEEVVKKIKLNLYLLGVLGPSKVSYADVWMHVAEEGG